MLHMNDESQDRLRALLTPAFQMVAQMSLATGADSGWPVRLEGSLYVDQDGTLDRIHDLAIQLGPPADPRSVGARMGGTLEHPQWFLTIDPAFSDPALLLTVPPAEAFDVASTVDAMIEQYLQGGQLVSPN